LLSPWLPQTPTSTKDADIAAAVAAQLRAGEEAAAAAQAAQLHAERAAALEVGCAVNHITPQAPRSRYLGDLNKQSKGACKDPCPMALPTLKRTKGCTPQVPAVHSACTASSHLRHVGRCGSGLKPRQPIWVAPAWLQAVQRAAREAKCGVLLVLGRDVRPLRDGWCLAQLAASLSASGPEALHLLPMDPVSCHPAKRCDPHLRTARAGTHVSERTTSVL
jgi:hypothetical protein